MGDVDVVDLVVLEEMEEIVDELVDEVLEFVEEDRSDLFHLVESNKVGIKYNLFNQIKFPLDLGWLFESELRLGPVDFGDFLELGLLHLQVLCLIAL